MLGCGLAMRAALIADDLPFAYPRPNVELRVSQLKSSGRLGQPAKWCMCTSRSTQKSARLNKSFECLRMLRLDALATAFALLAVIYYLLALQSISTELVPEHEQSSPRDHISLRTEMIMFSPAR